jgi:hypothetical protein
MFNHLRTLFSFLFSVVLILLLSPHQEVRAQASALMTQRPGSTPAPAPTDAFGSLVSRSIEFHTSILVTPVLTPSLAYAAGNCLGTVLAALPASRFTPPSLVSQGPDFTTIVSIVLTDKSANQAPIDVYFLGAANAGTYVDKTACNLTADATIVSGVVSFLATDWTSVVGTTVGVAFKAVAVPTLTTNTTLRLLLVSRGTPTFALASSLSVRLVVRED